MARDEELQNRKVKLIKEHYESLTNVKECGVKKFTQAYCIAKTAEKFFLRPKTVEFHIYS